MHKLVKSTNKQTKSAGYMRGAIYCSYNVKMPSLYFQFLGKMLFYFDTLRVRIKTFTHIHAAMYFDTSAFDFSAVLRSSNVCYRAVISWLCCFP